MHVQSLKNDSGYIMERNRGSIVADSHDYPYLDSQDSPYSWLQDTNYGAPNGWGGYGGGDYWGGSSYGGYSDPYYDVWGHEAPSDAAGKRAANDINHVYNRSETHNYHPGAHVPGAIDAPSSELPSVKWSGDGAHFSTTAEHPSEAKADSAGK